MKNKSTQILQKFIILFIITSILVACDEDYQPKPRAYFRIQLPKKEYHHYKNPYFPYSFSIPTYAKIEPVISAGNKYWINIYYPNFNAQLHISYKPIHHNLDTLLNDVHSMMNKHIPKANAINEQLYLNANKKVYGMTYEIQGSEAASPFQFYVTDSTTHFLRGALYFNFSPNNDSLKPVIEFLEADIREMIDSFKWEEIKL